MGDHQFRPTCIECQDPMSLMVYCEKNLKFVFYCETCDSEDTIVIKTDIKRSEFKKLGRLERPIKREITISSKI